MPKANSTVKAVRIDNDILAEFEQKLAGQTINSWLNEQIEEYVGGVPSEKNEDKRVNPQKTKKSRSATPELKDIESMIELYGISLEDFYSQIDGLMNEGTIDVSSGKVTVVLPDWAAEFAEACHDCSIPVEEAGKKAAKALRKGSI